MALPHTLTIRGSLLALDRPLVMGILNVTPDSFFAGSRYQTEREILQRAEQILMQGGRIIDLGAYSSRPTSVDISPEEEMARLQFALEHLTKHFPEAIYSVDTFRASVARRCVEEYGVDMINDISGGTLDEAMFETIADLQVPYVMMHMRGTPQTMMQNMTYENLLSEMHRFFSERLDRLYRLGVNDVILDPGFGFSKDLDQNYQLMHHLQTFAIHEAPLLVGVSRKSMIYKLLDCTPSESLNGTSVLHTLALLKGAHILRVHDVREAYETIQLVEKTLQSR